MIDQITIKEDRDLIIQCFNDMKALITSQNKQEEENLIIQLNKEKDKLLKSKNKESIARSAVINYVVKYNHTVTIYKVKNENNFIEGLINSFLKENMIELSLNKISDIFKDPSPLRIMISFGKKISQDKKYLELYFKLILLKQNIQEILNGIKILLGIDNNEINNQMNKLNLENPYAILLLRDLIDELIIRDIKQEDKIVFKNVLNNLKNNYLFHCPKCSEILSVNFLKEITVKCVNNHFCLRPKSVDELKNAINNKSKCEYCKCVIEIYEDNYKCLNCKHFYCKDCSEYHKKEDIKNVLINVYNVGFMCEKHLQLYITFCAKCKKNLCKICKECHPHKVGQKIYEVNEQSIDLNANKNLDELIQLDNYISTKLSIVFSYMKDFSFTNLFIQFSIWLKEKIGRNDEINKFKFFFTKFYDSNFQKYYQDLITKVSEGKLGYYRLLISIKYEYEKANIATDDAFISFTLSRFQINKDTRSANINRWISDSKIKIASVEYTNSKMDLKNQNIKINNQSLKYKSENELLKIKIMALFKLNDLYSSYLMKITNRYLADYLIRKLIVKYPSYFNPIEINNNIFYELATSEFNGVLFKNVGFLKKLKKQLKFDGTFNNLSEKEKVEKIQKFIDNLKDKNEISFKKPLKIGNDTFTILEMNFILDILFYFKKQGNIIAHINIKPKNSIKLKKVDKNVPKIKILLKYLEDPNNSFEETEANDINNGHNNKIIINKIDNLNQSNENSNIIIENFPNANKQLIKVNKNELIDIKSNLIQIKKIIGNIKEKNEDWLEIENKIGPEIVRVISEIKEEIIKDFYEPTINTQINIDDIMKCIFENNYKNIYGVNSAFTRGLLKFVDELTKKENIRIKFSVFDEIKYGILKTYENIKLIEDYEKNFKKLRIRLNDKIYLQTKYFIDETIKTLSLKDLKTNMISIQGEYSNLIDNLTKMDIYFNYLEDSEKVGLILSLILPIIKKIEIKNLSTLTNNFQKSIQNYFVLKNVKEITEKIHNYLDKNINKKLDDDKNSLNNIKKTIITNNPVYSNIGIVKDERIFYIISKIFESQEIEWTKIENSDISLESLLFYHQNK